MLHLKKCCRELTKWNFVNELCVCVCRDYSYFCFLYVFLQEMKEPSLKIWHRCLRLQWDCETSVEKFWTLSSLLLTEYFWHDPTRWGRTTEVQVLPSDEISRNVEHRVCCVSEQPCLKHYFYTHTLLFCCCCSSRDVQTRMLQGEGKPRPRRALLKVRKALKLQELEETVARLSLSWCEEVRVTWWVHTSWARKYTSTTGIPRKNKNKQINKKNDLNYKKMVLRKWFLNSFFSTFGLKQSDSEQVEWLIELAAAFTCCQVTDVLWVLKCYVRKSSFLCCFLKHPVKINKRKNWDKYLCHDSCCSLF